MNRALFSPVQMRDLRLRNRIVMAPMTRNRAADDGTPTELMAEHYRQRASAGLIITEMTVVSAGANAYINAPGLYLPQHVEGWRKVTDAVHASGGLVVAQIAHAGRISHPLLLPDGELPVAPSAVRPEGQAFTRQGKQPFVTPRALETGEIPGIVEQFRHAASLAVEAGFDGIEVHAANGYLLDQFLRDKTNLRDDKYGGPAANRVLLTVEIAKAIAGVWGPGRVGVRLSPFNTFNDIADAHPAETFSVAAEALAPLFLAYLHVFEPVTATANGSFTAELHKRFAGAVIANGGHTASSAASDIARGTADAVSFGAPFIANPDLAERFAAGAPLNAPDPSTFYMGGPSGYIDYPRMNVAGPKPSLALGAA
jgi:N-ethylmaleimide reductase